MREARYLAGNDSHLRTVPAGHSNVSSYYRANNSLRLMYPEILQSLFYIYHHTRSSPRKHR